MKENHGWFFENKRLEFLLFQSSLKGQKINRSVLPEVKRASLPVSDKNALL